MKEYNDVRDYNHLSNKIYFNGGLINVSVGTHGWPDKKGNLIKKTRYFSASFRVPSKHHMYRYVMAFYQLDAPDIHTAYQKALVRFKEEHKNIKPKEVKRMADEYYGIKKHKVLV